MKNMSWVACVVLLLSACHPTDQQPSKEAASTQAEQKTISVDTATVQASLAARNFGLAASQAEQLVGKPSPTMDEWFVAAEARAANSERLTALVALEKAIQAGMRDLGRIEKSTHLAALQQSDEYHAVLERAGLVKNLATSGDAVVRQRGNAIEVKAGDVSVTLPE